MKKGFSLLIALVLALSALVSCGNGGDDLLTHKYNYDLSEYIDLAEYKSLPAEGYAMNITDAQVEQQIYASRVYYSRSTVIDTPAEVGDIVYMDYEATDAAGNPIEGAAETDCEVTIGLGAFIDEVENALIGVKAGDHLSVNGVMPDPYLENPDISGQSVHFDIDVTEVRMQELPEYTEDFVRAYLGYDSKEDYEAAIRVMLENHYTEVFYQYVIEQVWPSVCENTTVRKFPDKELREMYEDMVSANQAYAEAKGIAFASYCENFLGMTEDEFYDYAQKEAENHIKEEMIQYAIARAEGLTLSEEEYQTGAAEYAIDIYGLDSLAEFESYYDKATIRQTLLFDKVKETVADYAEMTYLDPIVPVN